MHSVDAEFIPGESFIYGGKANWKGSGDGDSISVAVVAQATALTDQGSDLPLVVDSNTGKISWVGSEGTHNFAGIPTVVESIENDGNWVLVNGELQPNFTGDGKLDLYDKDMTVAKFINNIFIDTESCSYTVVESDNAWKILLDYINFRFPSKSKWFTKELNRIKISYRIT